MNEVILVFLLYLAYMLSYVSRKNIVFLAPHLLDYGFTKAHLGASQSAFTACYLVSKLSSNLMCTWAAPRVVLSLGITSVGVVNVVAGMLAIPEYLWVLWGINGLFCGMCWPPIGQIVVSTFAEHKRGKVWSFLTTSMNMGSTISPLLTDFLVVYTSWNLSLTATGIADVLVGVVLFLALPSHVCSSDTKSAPSADASSRTPPWKWDMLFNKFMALLATTYTILTFSVISMSTWGQMLFMEKLGIDTFAAGGIVSVYEIGGFCGSFLSGFLADSVAKNFKTTSSPRSYPAVLGCGIAAVSAFCMQSVSPSYLTSQICAFGYGFGTFGAISMFGLMAREYIAPEYSGILTASLAVASQVGAFCAGTPLAWLYETRPIVDGFWIVAYVVPVALVSMSLLTLTSKKYKVKDE